MAEPTHVVVDNTNLEAIVADATGIEPEKVPEQKPEEAEPKVEKTEEEEDENGLTPTEKKELTAKMQKAIGKKTAKLREAEEAAFGYYNEKIQAERRAEQLERENARLKAQSAPPPEEPKEPVRTNFTNDSDYQKALVDFRVDQKLKEKAAQEAEQREQERMAQIAADAGIRIKKAMELVPDFEDVTSVVDMQVPNAVASYMQESELFAEIAYYLAKNTDRLEAIQKMHPGRQLVEIGKIESILKPFSEETTEKATQQSAPAPKPKTEPTPSRREPIQPHNMGGANQVEKEERDMTPQEAIALYQKRNKINLQRRQRH